MSCWGNVNRMGWLMVCAVSRQARAELGKRTRHVTRFLLKFFSEFGDAMA
jgi:hypothetical protein